MKKITSLIVFLLLVNFLYPQSPTTVWISKFKGNAYGGAASTTIAIVVDSSGNTYITGNVNNTGTHSDYATIKYNSNGVQQWAKIYDGPRHDPDNANALSVDASGNVYVTGTAYTGTYTDSYVTIKYNTDGVQQWLKIYNTLPNGSEDASAIAVDVLGNVYVTGTGQSNYSPGNYDYSTIKYNSGGVLQWAKLYNGPGNNPIDNAKAIAVDALGNVYVTGNSWNATSHEDYATVKYNSSGVQQWARVYNGSASGADIVTAMALDSSGNIYVTGTSKNSNGNSDFCTIKYDNNGVQQWVNFYDGGGTDFVSSIALDRSGNIYATGSNSSDYTTIKYNSGGVQQWISFYNGIGNSGDGALAIAVDASESVYVTGFACGDWSQIQHWDYATVKYNSSGVQQWAGVYNGTGNSWDRAYAITLDASGNVYVTGQSTDTTGYYEFATIKYLQPTTGILSPILTSSLNLYPNPANDMVNIVFNNETTSFHSIEITDIAGKKIYTTLLNEQNNLIDISAYAQGVYLFIISDKNGTEKVVKKVVKE